MARAVTAAAITLFVSFWVLVNVAGDQNLGYLQSRDFISSLASFGARRPWLGVLAILASAVAYLLVAPLLYRWDRVVGAGTAVAGVALVVVAAFRIHCPTGAAQCLTDQAGGWTDVVHASAVVVYTGALVTAMVALGVHCLRHSATGVVGVPGLVMAVLFLVAFAGLRAASPGVPQRIWALLGQVWLVGAAIVVADELEHHGATRAGARTMLRRQQQKEVR